MNLFESLTNALPYEDFLARYGTAAHQARWKSNYDRHALTAEETQLIQSFRREMKVLVLAGAWCGDCAGQCPAFRRFEEANAVIQVRFLDRDTHAEVQQALRINGGDRVPVAVFFSEDGFEVARYGERTLAQYRRLMQDLAEGCPTGLVAANDDLPDAIRRDWLREFERIQYILRLSPRLRRQHGD